MIAFMYEGVLHSCPAQLQDIHTEKIDIAHQFDMNIVGVSNRVAVVLSF